MINVSAHVAGVIAGMIALTVFVVSVVIYGKRDSFGDAALGLVAGVVVAFAVTLDVGKFQAEPAATRGEWCA